MYPHYDYGVEVRVLRNIRNDGTYPGMEMGDFLVRRGSIGFVRAVGTFLQDQVIYSVHFLEADKIVGCREEELILATDPWTPTRFEFRDKVQSTIPLAISGAIVATAGSCGEILKVLRNHQDGVAYHVRFPGRTLLVPETVLEPYILEPYAEPPP